MCYHADAMLTSFTLGKSEIWINTNVLRNLSARSMVNIVFLQISLFVVVPLTEEKIREGGLECYYR